MNIFRLDFFFAGAEDKDKFRNRLEPVIFYDFIFEQIPNVNNKNKLMFLVYVLSEPRYCLPMCSTGSAFTSVAYGKQRMQNISRKILKYIKKFCI